jgi:hypothetical protein
MKAIERAKQHFDSFDLKEIEVPEWGDEEGNPLLIYAKPLTLAEQSKIVKYAKDDEVSLMAYTLIFKGLDKEGNKLFDLNDKQDLMNNVDRLVLARISAEIMDYGTIDDHRKK